jgi:hypothetical protein
MSLCPKNKTDSQAQEPALDMVAQDLQSDMQVKPYQTILLIRENYHHFITFESYCQI